MRTADWTDAVSVLDRICAILDAFGDDDRPIGVTELARRANLPKSTVSRVVGDLAAHRLLDREGATVHLGVRLFEYAQEVELPRTVRQQALPVLGGLRDATGLSAVVALRHGEDVLVVATARGTLTPVRAPGVGAVLPGALTALGRAVADAAAVPGRIFVESGEHRPDVAAVACAVRWGADAVGTAAIAVHGSCGTVAPDAVRDAVRGAARALTARLATATRRA